MNTDEASRYSAMITEKVFEAGLTTQQFGALVTTLITMWLQEYEPTFEGRRKFFETFDAVLTKRFSGRVSETLQ